MAIEGTEAAGPRNVAEARRAVEESRERISDTLDTLEARLRREKEKLAKKADVLRPVREQARTRPLIVLGVAFAAGLLIGRLGGGSEDYDDDDLPPARRRRSGSFARDVRNQLVGALLAAVAEGVTHRIAGTFSAREPAPPGPDGRTA